MQQQALSHAAGPSAQGQHVRQHAWVRTRAEVLHQTLPAKVKPEAAAATAGLPELACGGPQEAAQRGARKGIG